MEPPAQDKVCRCVLHEPPDDEASWDQGDRKLVADVEEYGWHVCLVTEDDATPGWAFTVGLWHTFGHPEVAMFGLRGPDMHHWLNAVGEQARNGQPLVPEEPRPGILAKHPVIARPVHVSWYPDFFGYALWFGHNSVAPILQVIWPDKDGRFPWEEGSGHRSRVDQPQLWIPREDHATGAWTRLFAPDDWPFPDGPATSVISTRRIVMEGRAVTYVVREPNGDCPPEYWLEP